MRITHNVEKSMKYLSSKIIALVFILVGVIVVGWWVFSDPVDDIVISNAGEDNRGKSLHRVVVNIGEFFSTFAQPNSQLQESWPRFRGADFDNISKSPIPLIDRFGPNGPDTLWTVRLGEGHSGAAIYKGLVYVLDYDEERRADVLNCIDLISGEKIWERWYKVNIKRNHGMSRTIPAVTEKYILSMGPRTHLMCMERESGDLLWGKDIAFEYDSEIPLWYTGQCPLIDDGVAIIATGGKALMIGIDCKSGETLWEVPNPDGWKMSHASVMPYTFAGKRMYVYSADGGVFAVSADASDKGQLLWKSSAWNHAVVAPSAMCMPDGKIFLTAGYGAGSMMLQLTFNQGFKVDVLGEYKPSQALACEQQTVLYYENHLFGILPKDGGSKRNQLICVHPEDITKDVWSSGKEHRFGLGPYMIADGKIFLLNDDGTLNIIKASSQSFQLLDQASIIQGHDAWAPLALANGYMVLRDAETMVCVDLRKRK